MQSIYEWVHLRPAPTVKGESLIRISPLEGYRNNMAGTPARLRVFYFHTSSAHRLSRSAISLFDAIRLPSLSSRHAQYSPSLTSA